MCGFVCVPVSVSLFFFSNDSVVELCVVLFVKSKQQITYDVGSSGLSQEIQFRELFCFKKKKKTGSPASAHHVRAVPTEWYLI